MQLVEKFLKNPPESIHIKIPVRVRLKLENHAETAGVTMSWICRALLYSYRKHSDRMPVYVRPNRLKEKCVDFSLKLYGDKKEILLYARANGGEFSPFLRQLLDWWLEGKLPIDLNNTKTVKSCKSTFFV